MDIIRVYDKDGIEKEMEVCFICNENNKHYIVYRDLNKENYYASYYKTKDGEILPELYNDLTDEEYSMLEKLYKKAVMPNV